MAGDTGVIDSALTKTDPPGLNILLVTNKALSVNRGAVLPFIPVGEISMACNAGGLLFEANQVNIFCFLQVMAINATLR